MTIFAHVTLSVLIIAIEIITMLMLIRAILSWFPVADRSSKFMSFVYMLTDPVIRPVKSVLERFPSTGRFPIDISFLVTYILLHLIQTALVSLRLSL